VRIVLAFALSAAMGRGWIPARTSPCSKLRSSFKPSKSARDLKSPARRKLPIAWGIFQPNSSGSLRPRSKTAATAAICLRYSRSRLPSSHDSTKTQVLNLVSAWKQKISYGRRITVTFLTLDASSNSRWNYDPSRISGFRQTEFFQSGN